MTGDALTRRYVELGLYQGQALLVLDLLKCTRCDECVRACADSHGGVTRVARDGPRFGHFLVPLSCRSCHDPRCLVGCPVDAIHREGAGLEVRIDAHCIGCELCVHNCPFGSIHSVVQEPDGRLREKTADDRARGDGVRAVARLRAVNCDLCAGSGTGPRCVYACPHDAAHRLTGDEVLRQAEAAAQPRTSAGLWATLRGLLGAAGE